MKSRRVLPIAALAMVLAVAGCGTPGDKGAAARVSGPPDPDATLRAVVSGNPTGFDPQQMKSALSDPGYLAPVYDQLIRLDATGKVTPMLAESWQMAPDNRSMTMKLRDGVKFQDGTPFNAAAVKANLERAKTLPTSTGARLLTTLTAVAPLSDDSVRLSFAQPEPAFPFTLASNFSVSAMISPAAMSNPDLAQHPVGVGGMRLVKMGQDRAEYEKAPGYWDPAAYNYAKLELISILDNNARVNALQTGQVDMVFALAQQYSAFDAMVRGGKAQLFKPETSQLYGLYLNAKVPGLEDPRVRRALSMAINRKAITDGLFNGQGTTAYQPLPPGMPGHVDGLDRDPFDAERAKQLLAEAGQPHLALNVISPGIEPPISILQVLQDEFAAVGVTLGIDTVAGSAARATWRDGKHDGYLSAITIGLDPSVFASETVLGPDNPGGPGPQLKSLVDKAQTVGLDSPDRAAAYQAVSTSLADGPLEIPIVRTPYLYLANPRVQNLKSMQPLLLLGASADTRYLTMAKG